MGDALLHYRIMTNETDLNRSLGKPITLHNVTEDFRKRWGHDYLNARKQYPISIKNKQVISVGKVVKVYDVSSAQLKLAVVEQKSLLIRENLKLQWCYQYIDSASQNFEYEILTIHEN
jgi:D-alanine-D-alanine ligase-like ATP-grasp enzyme